MRYEQRLIRIKSIYARVSDSKKNKKTYLNQDSVMIRFQTESNRMDHATGDRETRPATGSILVRCFMHHPLLEIKKCEKQITDHIFRQGDFRNVLLQNDISQFPVFVWKADIGNGTWFLLHRYKACEIHQRNKQPMNYQSHLQTTYRQMVMVQDLSKDDAACLLRMSGEYRSLLFLLSGSAVDAEERVGLFDELRRAAGEEDAASEVFELVGAVSVLLEQLDAVVESFTDSIGFVVFEGVEDVFLVLPVRVYNALHTVVMGKRVLIDPLTECNTLPGILIRMNDGIKLLKSVISVLQLVRERENGVEALLLPLGVGRPVAGRLVLPGGQKPVCMKQEFDIFFVIFSSGTPQDRVVKIFDVVGLEPHDMKHIEADRSVREARSADQPEARSEVTGEEPNLAAIIVGILLEVFDQKGTAGRRKNIEDTAHVTVGNQAVKGSCVPALFCIVPDTGVTAEFINANGVRKMGRPVKLDGVHDMANNRFRNTITKRDIFDGHNGLKIYTDFEIERHGDTGMRIEPVDRLRERDVAALAEVVPTVESQESVLLCDRYVTYLLYAAALLHTVITATVRADAERRFREYHTVFITRTVLNNPLNFKLCRVLGNGG